MRVNGFLTVNSRGTARFTKNKSGLNWDEISVQLVLDIPNELFKRPLIQANLVIDPKIVPKPQPVEAILNTKELIEESTGAKIVFQVLEPSNSEQE